MRGVIDSGKRDHRIEDIAIGKGSVRILLQIGVILFGQKLQETVIEIKEARDMIVLRGDPDNGIEPGTAFEDLPEDWVCPLCGVGKEDFSPED